MRAGRWSTGQAKSFPADFLQRRPRLCHSSVHRNSVRIRCLLSRSACRSSAITSPTPAHQDTCGSGSSTGLPAARVDPQRAERQRSDNDLSSTLETLTGRDIYSLEIERLIGILDEDFDRLVFARAELRVRQQPLEEIDQHLQIENVEL